MAMSKTASRIAIGSGIVVVLIVVAAIVVLGRLGRLIEHGVETAGPKITGTEVSLGGARVSIFDGEGALRGLHVGNPDGFTTERAFELGEIAIAIDVKSVTSDVIHVRSLVVRAPRVVAEFDAAGRSNLDRILANARAAGGAKSKSAAGKEGEDSKPVRLIIDEFRFEGAELRALAPAYGLDKSLKLAPVVRKGLGARQGGATAADLTVEVLRPIVEAAMRAAMKEYLDAQRAKLGDKAKEGLLDKLFN